jgi:hypothetical protein
MRIWEVPTQAPHTHRIWKEPFPRTLKGKNKPLICTSNKKKSLFFTTRFFKRKGSWILHLHLHLFSDEINLYQQPKERVLTTSVLSRPRDISSTSTRGPLVGHVGLSQGPTSEFWISNEMQESKTRPRPVFYVRRGFLSSVFIVRFYFIIIIS